jgi:transposase
MVSVLAADPLVVSDEQREELERMARSSSLSHRTVTQARALLLAAEGVSVYETARRVGVASNSVRSWRRRFETEGVAGVGRIARGRGRRSWVAEDVEEAVVNDTLHVRPDDGSTHWTTRSMAARHGIGKDTVARIWRKHELRPWRVETFKVSDDPNFEAKLVDVVGLYLDPPEKAIVFSFDEKTQVQALDRTQASLPIKRGRAGTMTHDYKRHGTTDVFAAMNVATGEVLYDTRKRHTATDVLGFFKLIDLHVPNDLEIHVVLDNLSAHKAPPVAKWLADPKRARWHLHFTPTSSSGSTWSKDGSRCSPSAGCKGACSTPLTPSSTPSKPGPNIGTTTPNPSSGPRPPRPSWPKPDAQEPPCMLQLKARRTTRFVGGDDFQEQRGQLERTGVRRIEGQVDMAVTVVLWPYPSNRAAHGHTRLDDGQPVFVIHVGQRVA